jgi:hypothetical protein
MQDDGFFNRCYFSESLRSEELTKTFPYAIPRLTQNQAARCGNTFAFVCFEFIVRFGTWQGFAPKVQPPPKSPHTLATAVLATCPRMQGYKKEPTFPH